MPILHCPHCRTPVDIHPDDAGYKVLCPNCHSAFQAGDAERPAPEPLPRPPIPEQDAVDERTVISRCTACRGKVEVGSDDVGHLMECPLCGEKFRAAEDRPQSRRSSQQRPSRVRSTAGRDDDDDADEDDYDDRRSRRRHRDQDKGYILESARAAIAWPANGLLWTGVVCSILCLVLSIGLGIAAMIDLDEPDPYNQQNYIALFVYAGLIAVGVPYHILMAVAGHQMKKLNGTGWAYTGAALGIATIIFTGMCSPTTWACMTFGIWTLVAFSRREVQDAIRINTGRR